MMQLLRGGAIAKWSQRKFDGLWWDEIPSSPDEIPTQADAGDWHLRNYQVSFDRSTTIAVRIVN